METIRILTIISLVWVFSSFLFQWIVAWGGGRKEYSVRSGNPGRGVWYNFTAAMMPAHKDTIRLHPVKFTMGVMLHIGALFGIFNTILLLAAPSHALPYPLFSSAILLLSFLAAIYLLIRRMVSPEMRAISCPDDYFAISMTGLFILLTAFQELGHLKTTAYLLFASTLFFYMPLGKLKHALFFFIARTDYGRRLGYRGVYPATRPKKEPANG